MSIVWPGIVTTPLVLPSIVMCFVVVNSPVGWGVVMDVAEGMSLGATNIVGLGRIDVVGMEVRTAMAAVVAKMAKPERT